MSTTEPMDAENRDARIAAHVFQHVERPPEVTDMRVELGTDHSGDPAMWIFLQVKPNLESTREQVKILSKFVSDVQLQILSEGAERFPYVRFEEAA